MLLRFCLYGFLKNQQYYDPFLILAFREKGLSFALIGLLIGFREICINVMEIPTGAIADVAGRRRSMILSFLAYIAAFAIFAFAQQLWLLFAAMFFFSIGEAFRTGSHKAMIFDWLERQDRSDEKTKIYGFTRSWSKMGSALSVLIAAALVFATKRYSNVFLFCIVPYVLNIINFLTYPSYLDGPRAQSANIKGVAVTLYHAFRSSIRNSSLRRLFAETMCFEGTFKVCKDYVQPVIQLSALSLPIFLGLADFQRTAILVGAVYFVLYLLSSSASRHADAFVKWVGSERTATRRIWVIDLAAFGLMSLSIALGFPQIAIVSFIALWVIQNFWRPIVISRIASHADSTQMATVLSIESQVRSL
ncbi:MAG: MFS transporter, partial [Planctomycetota bacterium]